MREVPEGRCKRRDTGDAEDEVPHPEKRYRINELVLNC